MEVLADPNMLPTPSMVKNRNGGTKRKHTEDVDSRGKRLKWTKDLHGAFLSAVAKLGLKAVPSAILNEMKVTGLTRENVASHLQKFRIQVNTGKISLEDILSSPLVNRGPENTYYFTNDGHSSSFEVSFEGSPQSFYANDFQYVCEVPSTGNYNLDKGFCWPVPTTYIPAGAHFNYDQFPDSPESDDSYGSVSPVYFVEAPVTTGNACFCNDCQAAAASSAVSTTSAVSVVPVASATRCY